MESCSADTPFTAGDKRIPLPGSPTAMAGSAPRPRILCNGMMGPTIVLRDGAPPRSPPIVIASLAALLDGFIDQYGCVACNVDRTHLRRWPTSPAEMQLSACVYTGRRPEGCVPELGFVRSSGHGERRSQSRPDSVMVVSTRFLELLKLPRTFLTVAGANLAPVNRSMPKKREINHVAGNTYLLARRTRGYPTWYQ